MKALEAAPGVIQKSTRLFIMKEDVEKILGCGKSKAYDVLKEVNRIAKKKECSLFLWEGLINICSRNFITSLSRKWTGS